MTILHKPSMSCILTFAIILLCGCGLKTDYIKINYTQLSLVDTIKDAETITVRTQAVDDRKNKEIVGRKSMDSLGAIIAQNDVSDTVAEAIQLELQMRGFTIGDEGVVIHAQIIRFYNLFKSWPDRAVGEVIMDIQVRNRNGGIEFTKVVSGEGVNSPIVFLTGENTKKALELALNDAMRQIMNDDAFISGIFKASQTH